MATEIVSIRDAVVFRSVEYPHRYYEAVGPGVIKYLQQFIAMAVDDTTHDPCEFTNTIVETGGGDSTAVVTDFAGGALLITADALTDDGYKMQLGHGHGGAGENVSLASPFPLYFGVRFAINDVDQTDCLFGVCITDTACIDGVSDGMYFRSIDGSALLYFVTEKDSIEGATAVATLTDDAYIEAEFLFDGVTVTSYINGAETSSTAATDATFPNDELMRLTMEFLTGEDVANTCTISHVRMIHVQ